MDSSPAAPNCFGGTGRTSMGATRELQVPREVLPSESENRWGMNMNMGGKNKSGHIRAYQSIGHFHSCHRTPPEKTFAAHASCRRSQVGHRLRMVHWRPVCCVHRVRHVRCCAPLEILKHIALPSALSEKGGFFR